jgi:hypothetical protein
VQYNTRKAQGIADREVMRREHPRVLVQEALAWWLAEEG